MADQRISQLVALSKAGAAANDVLPIADISASETKKITLQDLVAAGVDLISTAEIDLAKLDQASTTKLSTEALADAAVTAIKLADSSSIAIDGAAPTVDNFSGRGWFDSSTSNLQVYDGTEYKQLVLPSEGIADQSITNAKLSYLAVTTDKVSPLGTPAYADGSVATAKLADRAVTASKIALGTITGAEIAPNAIGASELGIDSVTSDAVIANCITEVKLSDDAVSSNKLKDLAVTNAKIAENTIRYSKLNLLDGEFAGSKLAPNSVQAAALASLAVTTTKIDNGAVTTDKVADGLITTAKLATGAVTDTKLSTAAVTATKIAAGAVTSSALATEAVNTNALGGGAVTAAKLAAGAVGTAAISDASITASKLNLADGSLPGVKIALNSITADQLAGSSVATSELAVGAVTTDRIADGAVTAAKLAAGSITTTQIATGAISTNQLAPGVVTYDKLQATSSTDVLIGRSSPGGGTLQEIPCSAAGRTLLANTTASEQRSSLGLGTLATANGTWLDGSSFSGTSSGVNTGDQTITLTGAVTGSGTSSFTTTLAVGVVLEANLATASVTSAKIAPGAITAERLAGNSSTIVNASAPTGNGTFVGQHWLNTSTAIQYVWDGSSWLQESGITVIAIEDSTPIALSVSYPDPYSALLTTTLDTQGAGTIWAGPISGDDAAPTFRALVSTDLPLATATVTGAVKPGSGLTIPEDGSGTINHSNVVTAATINGITFDAQGHITAATPLAVSDIPELDASKIGTGFIPTDRIADDAITGIKLSDYSTAKLGEVLPIADYIGQIFLNPLDKTFFMWDGNVWVPIGISAGEIIFAGTYDASSNTITSVSSDGSAMGFTVGQPLPSPTTINTSYYVVVSVGGTGSAPAPTVALAPPDILLSNGSSWVELDVSSTYVAQNASNVAFSPAANLGSTTVQNALEEVSTECRNANNITSGTLAIARGGTGLASYSKGDILLGSAINTLATLVVGANGTVITADSAEPLGVRWASPAVYVSSVGSTTAALTITNPTTTPSLAIRSATTAVNGIVQLSDSVNTTSSTLAATPTAVKTAYDLAAAALPKAGGVLSGDLQLGQNVGIVYEGTTVDAFQTRIVVADPTADHTITFPNGTGTLALTTQFDDGTY